MHVLRGRNVNEVFPQGVRLLRDKGERVFSRGQWVLEYPEPVCSVYERPWERVLFVKDRDENPFFHFFEALWILAGRDDVAFLAQFNSKMREYSDDGLTFRGAYGDRLRHWQVPDVLNMEIPRIDQLNYLIENLKKEPNSRRGVLCIWNPAIDLDWHSVDIPCNDMIFVKIRNFRLDMTVCCRSNDILWGAYGANVVQFSVLQEYLAARLAVPIGILRQISDSFHVYPNIETWDRVLKSDVEDLYSKNIISGYPMICSRNCFDQDLYTFMDELDGIGDAEVLDFTSPYDVTNPFFKDVAWPMYLAWQCHKREKNGLKAIQWCKAPDWRLACQRWLEKRETNNAGISPGGTSSRSS